MKAALVLALTTGCFSSVNAPREPAPLAREGVEAVVISARREWPWCDAMGLAFGVTHRGGRFEELERPEGFTVRTEPTEVTIDERGRLVSPLTHTLAGFGVPVRVTAYVNGRAVSNTFRATPSLACYAVLRDVSDVEAAIVTTPGQPSLLLVAARAGGADRVVLVHTDSQRIKLVATGTIKLTVPNAVLHAMFMVDGDLRVDVAPVTELGRLQRVLATNAEFRAL